MSARDIAPTALKVRFAFLIRPHLLIRWRRANVEKMRKGDLYGPLGDGMWATHRVPYVFEFIAACGAPVASVGGSGDKATCRKCNQLAARARGLAK